MIGLSDSLPPKLGYCLSDRIDGVGGAFEMNNVKVHPPPFFFNGKLYMDRICYELLLDTVFRRRFIKTPNPQTRLFPNTPTKLILESSGAPCVKETRVRMVIVYCDYSRSQNRGNSTIIRFFFFNL